MRPPQPLNLPCGLLEVLAMQRASRMIGRRTPAPRYARFGVSREGSDPASMMSTQLVELRAISSLSTPGARPGRLLAITQRCV